MGSDSLVAFEADPGPHRGKGLTGNPVQAHWLAVARGDQPADLVLAGAQVFNVFTREWLRGDLAIAGGHVVGLGDYREATERVELEGASLVPGYIDAHVHLESSKLMVDEFARAVLPHGTTSIVADPHEIANVLGERGVRWFLEATEGLPLDVFVMAPSCVPASVFESPAAPLTVSELAGLLELPRVIGVAEMMNFPGVVAGEAGEMAKLQVGLTDHFDGHAPGLTGRALNAYAAAGIRSDHEATTYEEALEKRRLGLAVMLREGSGARNLRDLLQLVRRFGPENCMFCTDDREPAFLVEEGHLDQMLRVTVAEGVAVEDALLMATLNPARQHRLRRLGAIAPGYQADILVLESPDQFTPRAVYKRGRVLGEFPPVVVPDWVRQSMRMAPVSAGSFRMPAGAGQVLVIGIVADQLLTTREVIVPTQRDGEIVADPARDLVKIAVVERHHATGRMGRGLVTNVGLQRGAFASTVAHDAHNLVVLGVDDEDMAICANRLAEVGGGIVVAAGGRVVGELPLPVGGLMSDQPLAAVYARMTEMEGVLKELGCRLEAPFLTISFLALSVIPELKITDRGLVDVRRFALVPFEVGP